MNEPQPFSGELEGALDAALARALAPPPLPAQFRLQLQAALARLGDAALREQRSRLEREQRDYLAELEASYVRLRRRTLASLIGGAFAAGAAVALVLPWLKASVGPNAPLVLAAAGTVLGLTIGAKLWLEGHEASSSLNL